MKIRTMQRKIQELEAEVQAGTASPWDKRQLEALRQKLEARQAALAAHNSPRTRWQDDPATERQLDYLRSLGVDVGSRTLTKGEASQLIDAVKSGQGVGAFGYYMTDGSN